MVFGVTVLNGRHKHVVELLTPIVGSSLVAESVVERLNEEGLLHVGFGDAEVDIIVDTFKEVFGATKTTKYDRFAAKRLAEKYGAKAVVGILRLLAKHSGQQYAPVVRSVAQLEEKMVSILAFLRKNGRGTEEIEV